MPKVQNSSCNSSTCSIDKVLICYIVFSGGSRNWEGGGGGAPARVWQWVGRSSRWGRPGEGAGGGHPSRPARGCGGALQAPPPGSGAPPQKPTLFA